MSTLADAAVRAHMRERIQGLTPKARRQWGRMTPHQMICHLGDGFRMAAGIRGDARVDSLFSRTFIRWIALHTPFSWPRDVKTLPLADQEIGGTKPVEWDRDMAELLRLYDSFQPKPGHAHPMFGPLTAEEWNIWAFRHTDHHLRQFGV